VGIEFLGKRRWETLVTPTKLFTPLEYVGIENR
jgi:hypothetical protein